MTHSGPPLRGFGAGSQVSFWRYNRSLISELSTRFGRSRTRMNMSKGYYIRSYLQP
jgi:hypothetical protein